uniref:Uncharacterized protein n=1 Tax=Timema douglasi TaxID=61478 RepID=A0A7R8VFR3_TIMDO|nr:unnamed protein product [Timema douglasi]
MCYEACHGEPGRKEGSASYRGESSGKEGWASYRGEPGRKVLKVVKPLKLLVTNSHQLERLNMGCSEHLSVSALGMINLISKHQARSLRHLGLATVKDDPNNYELLDLDPSLMRNFHRLQVRQHDVASSRT